MIDFSTITACGECCVGCKKELRESVWDALKRMGMYLNGLSLADVKYILVQESMEYSSVDCAIYFRVINYQQLFRGILTLLST